MPDRRRKRPRDPAPARQADDRYCLSDGHKAYLEAVEGAFGSDIDYAMLVKIYEPSGEGEKLRLWIACIFRAKNKASVNDDPLSTKLAADE